MSLPGFFLYIFNLNTMKRWKFEPGHSSAEFRVRHMMVTNVRGHFDGITGSIEFDPEHPDEGTVQAEINTSSICTGEETRDEHLRNDDFLGVEEYPEMTYQGKIVEDQGCNEFRVLGELTIRGITHEVPLDVQYLGSRQTPYWEDGEDLGPVDRIGFTASTRINRHDFNVNWQSELPDGGIVVGNTVWITLDIEALPTDFLT